MLYRLDCSTQKNGTKVTVSEAFVKFEYLKSECCLTVVTCRDAS